MSKELLPPTRVLAELTSTESFWRARHEAGDMSSLGKNERRYIYNHALGGSALDLAQRGTKESGYQTPEAQVFTLVGTMEPFLQAQITLDTARAEGSYKREEYLGEIERTIDFNHALREFIDHNSRLTRNEVQTYIVSLYNTMFSQDHLAKFAQITDRALLGMQHEIGFEQILNQFNPRVLSYLPATKEQELDGIDMIINYADTRIPVDIKAGSQRAAKLEAQLWPNPTSFPIGSHLGEKDFKGNLQIATETAKAKVIDVKQDLYRAAELTYQKAA